nr:hypothetical protein [Tanacetum cinerariifolium]
MYPLSTLAIPLFLLVEDFRFYHLQLRFKVEVLMTKIAFELSLSKQAYIAFLLSKQAHVALLSANKHTMKVFEDQRPSINRTFIEFGDSYKAPLEETGKGPSSESFARKKGKTVAITTEDIQKRRNDVKARTTLLLALPDEHQLRFSKYKTAKELWEAILTTFGGNEATKKTKKNQLKLQYGNFKAEGSETLEQTFNRLQAIVTWLMYTIVWRNRDDLDTMSLDDVYNHLKVYETEVQKKSELNSQYIAFISLSNTSSGKGEVHTASVPTASTQVSTASTDVAASSLSHDTICAYIATQSNGSQIKYEDITQIDKNDIEEMDIKWNMALLSMRGDRFLKKTGKKITIQGSDVAGLTNQKWNFYNCHKIGHFARECRAPRSQDRGKRESYKQGPKVKKEKESLDNNLTGFGNASKDLDNLLGSQRSDNNKEGLGYSTVPPPSAQIYSPPKKDLSWTGLLEFVDDTVTDYRRPTPSLKVRGNQRNWNNLKSQQLGKDFLMQNKACFKCGYFDHLASNCGVRVDNGETWPKDNYTHKSMTPRDVLLKPGTTPIVVSRPNMNVAQPKMTSFAKTAHSNVKRYMTGNISYLSEYEPYDGGYVSFGHGGGNITDKGIIKTDFKLNDDTNVLLRTPRQHNMYSIDLNNIFPHKNLTCLVAKSSVDERKQHKASCKTKLVNSVSKPLHTLYMDLFGPTSVCSRNHKWYCLVVTDDFSRFTWTFFLRTKDETSSILRNFITEIENLKELKVKISKCDSGGEFKNKEINEFYTKKGIRREFSNARTPQQNGVAKRRNRTLIEAARTMLADAKLPVTFWAEAVNTAYYVQDRVLVNKSQNKTPYELFNSRIPAIGFLRPFGCHVMILNTLDHLGNFDAKGYEGYFVGYSLSSKAFRVFNKRTKKVEENMHVDFLENKLIEKGAGPIWLFDINTLTNSMNYVPVVVVGTSSTNILGTKDVASQAVKKDVNSDAQDDPKKEQDYNDDVTESSGISNPTATLKVPSADQVEPTLSLTVESKILIEEPKMIFDGLKDLSWVESMQEELLQFKIQNMDVKSAFLYGSIDEEVYVMQPHGFQDLEFPERVYKLCREFKALMHDKFQMSAMDELTFFLGLQVLQKKEGIFISQDKYVGDSLKKFRYSDVRLANTPMNKENPWGKDGPGKDVELHLYRSMIGSLMYLTASRLDIMFAVYACARHQYPKESPFNLVAYSYSDYGGAIQDRKSTSGGCQFMGRRLISWQFKKQTIVATSTTKEEYVVAASGCGQVLWIQNHMLDYGRHLKLNDKEGISSLPDAELFENLSLMGYNNLPSQSNIATAVVCLATNRVYNFSKMIFDAPTETLTPRRLTKRAIWIAQSKALSPDADEPTSLSRDDRHGEAFHTISSLDAGQDRKTLLRPLPCLMNHHQGFLLLMLMRAVAREMEEEFARENQRLSEQAARDYKISRIHTEEELKLMIKGLDRNNEVISKHLSEYEQAEADLSRKPSSNKEQRRFYMSVLKGHDGWKTEHFKGMTLEKIKEKFIPVWKHMQDFVPMSSKEESEKVKRPRIKLDQGNSKRVKISHTSRSKPSQEQQFMGSKGVSKEELKWMMQLVPLEEVYIEAL